MCPKNVDVLYVAVRLEQRPQDLLGDISWNLGHATLLNEQLENLHQNLADFNPEALKSRTMCNNDALGSCVHLSVNYTHNKMRKL